MLDSVGADGRTDLPRVAREVAQAIPKRGLVVIISDLLGVDNLLEGLRVLRQRGHDVALFHVLHDDELDFEFNGATRFEGLEVDDFLNCNPRALREGYLEALNEFLEQTQKDMRPVVNRLHASPNQRAAGRCAGKVSRQPPLATQPANLTSDFPVNCVSHSPTLPLSLFLLSSCQLITVN